MGSEQSPRVLEASTIVVPGFLCSDSSKAQNLLLLRAGLALSLRPQPLPRGRRILLVTHRPCGVRMCGA